MNGRRLFLSVAVLSAALGAYACSSDPEETSSSSSGGASSSGGSSSGGSSSGGSSSGGSSNGGVDGGPTDAAADTGPTGPNAFTDAAAFVSCTNNANARVREHGGNGNPAKLACLTCHKTGGSAGGRRAWHVAGTVFKDKAGTMPAAGVQVAVRDGAGKRELLCTNADGNFWAPPNAGTNPAFPAKTGVRDTAATSLMVADIAAGDCNGCHKGGGGTDFIHVP